MNPARAQTHPQRGGRSTGPNGLAKAFLAEPTARSRCAEPRQKGPEKKKPPNAFTGKFCQICKEDIPILHSEKPPLAKGCRAHGLPAQLRLQVSRSRWGGGGAFQQSRLA